MSSSLTAQELYISEDANFLRATPDEIKIYYDGSPSIVMENRDFGHRWAIEGPDGTGGLQFIYTSS